MLKCALPFLRDTAAVVIKTVRTIQTASNCVTYLWQRRKKFAQASSRFIFSFCGALWKDRAPFRKPRPNRKNSRIYMNPKINFRGNKTKLVLQRKFCDANELPRIKRRKLNSVEPEKYYFIAAYLEPCHVR